MHRHIVVVSFLEWLNWNDKGRLRIAAGRLVWCSADSEAEAFHGSLQFAPDFEPADDAFLIAEIAAPPRVIDGGLLWLPLEGSRFSTLSERSSRLLSPAAERMNVALGLAPASVQEVWARWKDRCRVENADQQARRLWTWAFGRAWPTDSGSPEEECLGQTRVSWANMTELLATKPPLRDQISGTSVEAWMPMVLAAERAGLLATEKDADWRKATRAYIKSSLESGRIAPSFLQTEDASFRLAFENLPRDRPAMIELVAVATGAHHALRIVGGQGPEIGALKKDLQTLTNLVSDAEIGKRSNILTMSLLALGRLLPGSAVVALLARAEAPEGWASSCTEASPERAPPNGGADVDGGDLSCLATGDSQLRTVHAEVEPAVPQSGIANAGPDADHSGDPRGERPSASQAPGVAQPRVPRPKGTKGRTAKSPIAQRENPTADAAASGK
jgi:hypothetical protein